MTVCRDCGKKDNLEWAESKGGALYLVEVRRLPHRALCPKRKKAAPVKPKDRELRPALKFSADVSEAEQAALMRAIAKAEASNE